MSLCEYCENKDNSKELTIFIDFSPSCDNCKYFNNKCEFDLISTSGCFLISCTKCEKVKAVPIEPVEILQERILDDYGT
jgi:hypothetical protein